MKIHRVQLAKGVHPEMLNLIRQWSVYGSFEIAVALYGGLRSTEADQAMLSGSGMSAAAALIKTPHGRAAALDLVPLDFLRHTPVAFGGSARKWSDWASLPSSIREQFSDLGRFSEKLGYVWGGRWVGKSYPNGDQPHHELRGWQKLPFPAPVYEFPEDLAEMAAL